MRSLAAVIAGVLAASGAAAQEAPAPIDCGQPGPSIAEARALYDALPERVDDDATPVNDLEFMAALAAPRGENEDAVRWRFTPPLYPVSAMNEGIGANCAMAFDIATSGRAINIALSCTDPRFEYGVRRAAHTTLFLPALKDGAAIVKRRVILHVAFCMEG